MAPDELAEMESSIRADLKAAGTPEFLIEMKMRHRRDSQLADRAGVPPYEAWRTQHMGL